MGRKSKYSEIQMQFLLDHLNMKNVELKALFEEKFNAEIDRHYIANLRIRTRAKEEKNEKRFNLKIGDSYVNKDSKISEEVSEDVKENANLFREMAKKGVIIDFDITDECLEYFYDNSVYKLKDELDEYFKHRTVIDFQKSEGMQGFYRGTDIKEL